MTPAPIPAYVGRLRSSLRRQLLVPGRVVEEVREHLLDARDDAMRRGLAEREAEDEALRRLGPPEELAARIAATRRGAIERALALVSGFNVAATAFLTLSLLWRRPPGADLRWGLVPAGIALVQLVGAALMLCLATPASGGVRMVTATSGCLGLAAGGTWVGVTLSSPSFEGYAVVLGAAFVVQGLLTATRSFRASDRVAA